MITDCPWECEYLRLDLNCLNFILRNFTCDVIGRGQKFSAKRRSLCRSVLNHLQIQVVVPTSELQTFLVKINTHVVTIFQHLNLMVWTFQVNGQSLLGTTQQEAAQNLQAAGSSLSLLVCHGFDVTQCRRDSSAGVKPPSKESEILTPSLSKSRASPRPLPPLPSSSVKVNIVLRILTDRIVLV